MDVTAKRNAVTTYRKKGTFRAQHAEKTGRAAQRTALPPRCDHDECRQPGIVAVWIDDVAHFYCVEHAPRGVEWW